MDIKHVISDFQPYEENQICVEVGSMVRVLEKVNENWWWVESNDDLVGYVPSNHLSDEPLLTDDERWENEEYFEGYGHLKLHSEMLSDTARTSAYKLAIETGAFCMQNKVVLDVGCGTGILSLLCAKYGNPLKVYAVEWSNICKLARDTVVLNGFQDVIQVIQDKVENVDLNEKVDVIISEWMGTFLIFEYMIESVIIARDKYLKPGGIIWPSRAELYLVPCSAQLPHHERMGIWNDAYGFDFSCYIPLAKESLTGRPIYNHTMSADHCLSEPIVILDLNMSTVITATVEECEAKFDYIVNKYGTFHGFASWFKVYFDEVVPTICLSTAPDSSPTHWKQDLFLIDDPLEVSKGQRLTGSIKLTRSKVWRRHLRVSISYTLLLEEDIIANKTTKEYKIWR